MRRLFFIALFVPVLGFASSGKEIVEALIIEEWAPLPARVEWTFRGTSAMRFPEQVDFRLDKPLPRHLAGSLTLVLKGLSTSGDALSFPISGIAKIYGPSFTPQEFIAAGKEIQPAKLIKTELEWTNLRGTPVLSFDKNQKLVATHGLVPGRPLCNKDLKPAPVISKNQMVQLEYLDGGILIALVGKALKSGSIGEIIPVRVELEYNKRYRGQVIDGNTLRFIQ
jgi:flagella basal body P-ring formation protein FlgA